MILQTNEIVAIWRTKRRTVTSLVGGPRSVRRRERRRWKWRALAFLFALAPCLSGCDDSGFSDERKVLAVVRAHVAAAADPVASRAAGGAGVPAAENADNSAARLAEIGATFQLQDLKVEEYSDSMARVGFDLEVRGTAGFRPYRLSGIHKLQKIDGDWEIHATEWRRLEYLDEKL